MFFWNKFLFNNMIKIYAKKKKTEHQLNVDTFF
jgi:hypothetical protein